MSKAQDKARRASSERLAAGSDISLRNGGIPQLSKAELRASIPAYDESMVKRIETMNKGKRSAKN